jgi:N4-gp56 family major capsid protein
MAFTSNLTGTAQIDDSIVLAYDQQFIVTVGEETAMDQFAQYKQEIDAKSIQLTKYNRLSLATTPLSETVDITSEAVNDSQILIAPVEYGNAVTKTNLASLQSGGKIDLAIPTLVGKNMAMVKNKLAMLALEASSNALIMNGKTEPTLASTDIITGNQLNVMYNKLARANVPTVADGMYVMVAHDDVIHDLRQDAGWINVATYQNASMILKNEVGSYRGFKVVRNNLAFVADQSGAGTVDTYKTAFFGANGLGLVESQAPRLTITGPFDTLGRTINIGWYGVFKYAIVDTDAVWTLMSASSVGANLV